MKRCCFKCMANHTTLPFTDPSVNALWRPTEMTHLVFLQMCFLQGLAISPMFDILGLKFHHVDIDLMHCGDLLGICLYLEGSILYELFEEMEGVYTRAAEKLSELQKLIKCEAKAVGQDRPPVNTLTMPMLRASGKSPKAKFKAAESRHMLPVVRLLLERFFPQDTPHQILRYRCVRALDEMYKEMRKPEGEFNGAVAAKLARQHLILYAELVKESLDSKRFQKTGWLMYRWYPKHHLFCHFERQICISGSPALNWCYMDESAIGEAVLIAESCHPSTLHRVIIQKWRI